LSEVLITILQCSGVSLVLAAESTYTSPCLKSHLVPVASSLLVSASETSLFDDEDDDEETGTEAWEYSSLAKKCTHKFELSVAQNESKRELKEFEDKAQEVRSQIEQNNQNNNELEENENEGSKYEFNKFEEEGQDVIAQIKQNALNSTELEKIKHGGRMFNSNESEDEEQEVGVQVLQNKNEVNKIEDKIAVREISEKIYENKNVAATSTSSASCFFL
jgi:hypothetical protein